MHHDTAGAPETSGRVIRWARWYDLFGSVVSLGRLSAIREKLVELAAPGAPSSARSSGPTEQMSRLKCFTPKLSRTALIELLDC